MLGNGSVSIKYRKAQSRMKRQPINGVWKALGVGCTRLVALKSMGIRSATADKSKYVGYIFISIDTRTIAE